MSIKITATTKEQFESVEKQLALLTNTVRDQIDSARCHILSTGIVCHLADNFKSKPIIYLPKETKSIVHDGTTIRIFAQNLILEIDGEFAKRNLSYEF